MTTRRLPTAMLALALELIVAALIGRPGCAHAAQVAPDAHWGNRTIYVVNQAGPGWPVAGPIWEWNRTHVLNIVRVPACTGTGCLTIYRGGCASSRYDGQTFPLAIHGYLVTANIHLCPRALGYSYAKRREIVLHELGHALGLQHDTRSTSIMWPWTHVQYAPSSYDYALIARLYAHVPQ